ncbi:signal transducer and activator of transcription 6 isoform X2 [Tachysurus fulvidraco]|uniref:signal transducer and activator of transcription 6 isoform X2 n=1 Tax=Tachysurus fulvidraco TaxID=1234273 RepID=UPI000F4FF0E7|nr:signal transducer and activator of transcription 6 isoform X2 [Tachysurus fulvidraco]
MALWMQISQKLPYFPNETLVELYPSNSFPIDVRHYLASWIEEQRWEDFNVENREQEPQARQLLERMLELLQEVAFQNPNVVEKVKLQHISRNMASFQTRALELVKIVRNILRKERHLLQQVGQSSFLGKITCAFIRCQTRDISQQISSSFQPVQIFQQMPAPPVNGTPQHSRQASSNDVDNLVMKVLEIQSCRQQIHQLQEELNWEKQEADPMQGPNEMEVKQLDQVNKQKRIAQLEWKYKNLTKSRLQLLQEAVCNLEQCQTRLIHRIKSWRWEQLRSTIGRSFDENLLPLQTWCEQLLGVNGNLRQELMLVKREHGSGEQIHKLEESLNHLLQTLIQSSLVVEKQPPQVIKTQSKFSSTVRYLLGEKVAPGKPVLLKAQTITESQARNIGQGLIPTENVGDLINSTAILEHNTTSKSTCATFRNMSIRKIKRADRKGSESVTEEKFALLFTTEITITGCDSPYSVQVISLPVVVIVHGSQENNAMATIIWDCAFSEPNRIPFVVPDRVSWSQMSEALSCKFMSEVQTTHSLDRVNLHCLAQKIFDKPDNSEDFSTAPVSWAQFNKEVLPGRNFTFWQWFEGVIDLTKKCLKAYWSDGLILGFIGKQHLHVILQNQPIGTFLLRFSDSEIGGITIAYVGLSESGCRKIQNIQPFTKKDLDSVGLGDRIRDISLISQVYSHGPGQSPRLTPKNEAFKKYYTVPSAPHPDGYLPFKLTTVVGEEPGTVMIPQAEPMQDQFCVPQEMFNMRTPVSLPPTPFAPSYPDSPMPSQGEMYPTLLYSNNMNFIYQQ